MAHPAAQDTASVRESIKTDPSRVEFEETLVRLRRMRQRLCAQRIIPSVTLQEEDQ